MAEEKKKGNGGNFELRDALQLSPVYRKRVHWLEELIICVESVDAIY